MSALGRKQALPLVRGPSYCVRSHGAPWGPGRASDPVAQAVHAFGFRAVTAAEERAAPLKAVANDACAAMSAHWSERAYGAFETVEHMLLALHQDFKRLVVVVPARFANGHDHHLNGLREQRANQYAATGKI